MAAGAATTAVAVASPGGTSPGGRGGAPSPPEPPSVPPGTAAPAGARPPPGGAAGGGAPDDLRDCALFRLVSDVSAATDLRGGWPEPARERFGTAETGRGAESFNPGRAVGRAVAPLAPSLRAATRAPDGVAWGRVEPDGALALRPGEVGAASAPVARMGLWVRAGARDVAAARCGPSPRSWLAAGPRAGGWDRALAGEDAGATLFGVACRTGAVRLADGLAAELARLLGPRDMADREAEETRERGPEPFTARGAGLGPWRLWLAALAGEAARLGVLARDGARLLGFAWDGARLAGFAGDAARLARLAGDAARLAGFTGDAARLARFTGDAARLARFTGDAARLAGFARDAA